MTLLHTLTVRHGVYELRARLEVEYEAHPDPDGCLIDLLGVSFVDVTADRPDSWTQATLEAAVFAELLNQKALRADLIAACREQAAEEWAGRLAEMANS